MTKPDRVDGGVGRGIEPSGHGHLLPGVELHALDPLDVQVAQWQEEYAGHVHAVPEPVDPFAGLPLREDFPEGDGWERYGWCPELDLDTYAPVEEDFDHAPDPNRRAS